jgi:AcrR family transcriptional regulator
MSNPAKSLSSVSPPRQARSRATLERLLDAAEALIRERGLGGLSVPEVVRRAKSSTGSFYARFQDKNALLRALEERFFANLEALVDSLLDEARWRDVPTPELVAVCVREMLRSVEAHAELVRAFVARSAQQPGFEAEAMRFRERVVRGFRSLLLARRDEMRHPDPELAMDLALEGAFAFMQSRILSGGRPLVAGPLIDDTRLERELVRQFLAYVGIDAGNPARPHEERPT